jgi:alpha-tubulin suppressor-like RCC1 family protein
VYVYPYSGDTYLYISGKTNAQGQASFTLPDGSYRFRADSNGYAYWSSTTNNCPVPGCTTASVSVFSWVTVTVHDTNGNPDVGIAVRAFDGDTPTVYVALTNAQGQAIIPIPSGIYHFRANKNGTVFWSSPTNNCDPTSCSTASITTDVPVVVTVLNGSGSPVSGVYVYPYSGDTYLYISGKTNAQGQASFTLPDGSYRFRADSNGHAYWSSTTNNCPVPGCTTANISTGTGAFAVSSSLYFQTCAITDFGAAKCWGDNISGQLGDGTTAERYSPVNVVGLSSGVKEIAVGIIHTCALTVGGGVKCWGDNSYGELGDGTTFNRLTPVDVVGLTNGITAIAAGGDFSCALTFTGGVKCWGWNAGGELGDGTCMNSSTPIDVSGLTSGVTSISAGFYYMCAVTSSGGAKCWGDNTVGQLGDGTTTHRCAPVDVYGLTSGVQSITTGIYHTCALTISGGVKCWGENPVGELGNGTYTDSPLPTDVVGLTSGITAIDAGDANTCALTNAGGLKCWGDNFNYQLGTGIGDKSNIPIDNSFFTANLKMVSVSSGLICVITNADKLKCWGHNWYGQVGNGTTDDAYSPVDVNLD